MMFWLYPKSNAQFKSNAIRDGFFYLEIFISVWMRPIWLIFVQFTRHKQTLAFASDIKAPSSFINAWNDDLDKYTKWNQNTVVTHTLFIDNLQSNSLTIFIQLNLMLFFFLSFVCVCECFVSWNLFHSISVWQLP